MPFFFAPEEANRLLAKVGPLVEEIVSARPHQNGSSPRTRLDLMPTLCIVGADFPLMVSYTKEIASHIRGARLKVVDNSCEPTNLCQLQTFDSPVMKFMQELS